jgi:hypothetical protein
MSLTSYRAAPPRVEVCGRRDRVLFGDYGVCIGLIVELRSIGMSFAGLAATYSPMS